MRAIDITLDKPRRLRFTMQTLRALETDVRNSLGLPLNEAMGRWFSVTSRLLVLHGLRHEDRKLTLDVVEGLLQNHIDAGGDVEKVYDQAARALRLSGVLGAASAAAAQAELDAEAAAGDGEADRDPSGPAAS